MKENRFFVFGLITLIFALVLAGCGDNPKALAKQTYKLTQDVLSNPLKAVGGLVKASNIKKKVDKLSPANKQIYNEELARLLGQGDGGLGILGGIPYGDSSSAGETLNAFMGAMGMLNLSAPTAPEGETAKESSGGKTADSKSGGKGGQTTFTLTDIPSEYNGKYARISLVGGKLTLTGAQNINSKAVTLPKISNGKVVIPLWIIRSVTSFEKYSGNDTFTLGTVNIYNSGNDNVNAGQKELVDIVFSPSISFTNGNATKSWKEGFAVRQ
jgi:hypothetical protein